MVEINEIADGRARHGAPAKEPNSELPAPSSDVHCSKQSSYWGIVAYASVPCAASTSSCSSEGEPKREAGAKYEVAW